MKVLYLHNETVNSQMANLLQVKAMCKAMTLLGHNVTLSLLQSEEEDKDNVDHFPFKLHFRKRIFSINKIDKYLNFISIGKAIKEISPDLIYLRDPLLLKQSANSGKPIIIELHNNRLHLGWDHLNRFWTNYLINLAKKEKIKKIVCISDALKDFWLTKGLPENKLVTAHDGVDEEFFSIKDHNLSLTSIRVQLGLPLEKKIVSYAGRLYKDRKIDHILELAKKFHEVQFVIIGGPDSQSSRYKELAVKENIRNIIFTGQINQKDIPLYLYASDVLLALWSSEVKTINYCSPLKVFEYMAAEKIILAHGFPTILEVLQHNKNALIVKPDSLIDLIEKLSEALKMSYPIPIASQAKEDVLKHFTWRKRAELILDNLSL